MSQIILHTGERVLVDKADLDLLAKYSWHKHTQGYATSFTPMVKGKRKSVLMHRLIMGYPELQVDHINHNKLDNRKSNLRVVTCSENMINRHGLNENNKSGYRGISWSSTHKRWVAKINVRGKRTCIGYFRDINMAVRAHQDFAKTTFGDLYVI